MHIGNLENCIKGWFVGDFPNAVFQDKQVEIALKRYDSGFCEEEHYHSECTEVTVIVTGSVLMNNKLYRDNDVIVIEPYESTDFQCLTDVVTVVYKNKSSINDKHLGKYIKMNSINDVALFLDPHTFFSFLSEENDKVIVYVSHMNADVLKVINQVPDKVNGKHVLFHFESCLDDKHNPVVSGTEWRTVNVQDEFVPEDVPLYGLTESLKDLEEPSYEASDVPIDPDGDKLLKQWEEQGFSDFKFKVTTYVSNKE